MESKQKAIRWWSMTIHIDSTYQKRKICDMVFWVYENPSHSTLLVKVHRLMSCNFEEAF
jgi:hypothetical protein